MFGKIVFVTTLAALASTSLAAPACGTSDVLAISRVDAAAAKACTTATAFKLVPPTGIPSDDQLKQMCQNTDCQTLMAKSVNIVDCDYISGGQVVTNPLSVVKAFPDNCQRVGFPLSGSTPAPTPTVTVTPEPATTTPAPATTTPAPTTTTPAPTTTTPAPVTTTPAPKPTPPVAPHC